MQPGACGLQNGNRHNVCCTFLQVTQSLVDHLNTNLKAAIDKADDAEAEAVQVQQQVRTAARLTGPQAWVEVMCDIAVAAPVFSHWTCVSLTSCRRHMQDA
jgi:hypothetical protein